jgi:hypothetical protein
MLAAEVGELANGLTRRAAPRADRNGEMIQMNLDMVALMDNGRLVPSACVSAAGTPASTPASGLRAR